MLTIALVNGYNGPTYLILKGKMMANVNTITRVFATGALACVILLLVTLGNGGCDHEESVKAPSDAKWAAAESWKDLKKGLSMDEVRELLGEPTQVSTDRDFTRWKYNDSEKSATITFEGGKLRSWKGPDS